ncbi:MAG TPA: hypothetical protein VIC08_03895 [Cellvibrionaceae bacterium]
MKKLLLTGLLLLALIMPALSQACSEPAKPDEFPDPATAVTAQMVKANNDVKAYVAAMEEYLGCAGLSRGEQRSRLDELKEYAESFNVLIREFKARNS